jgi:hypothetical protein
LFADVSFSLFVWSQKIRSFNTSMSFKHLAFNRTAAAIRVRRVVHFIPAPLPVPVARALHLTKAPVENLKVTILRPLLNAVLSHFQLFCLLLPLALLA